MIFSRINENKNITYTHIIPNEGSSNRQVCNTEVLHEELKRSNMSNITPSLNVRE